MTRKFVIKKEIRSLGIDLCKPSRVIGAVVRGGLFLDGLVVFSPEPRRWKASIANEILQTRFYPELKLIMTHDPARKLNIGQIEKQTRLPVIDVRAATEKRSKGYDLFTVGKRWLQAKTSLETKTVQEILSRTWTTGSFPESLRIAQLVAKSRFSSKKPAVWANK